MSDDRNRTNEHVLFCPLCDARVEYEWLALEREYKFYHPGFERPGTLGGEAIGALGWHVEMRRLHRAHELEVA